MKRTKKLVESYLPIFIGFYDTIFTPDEQMVIEEPYNYDDYIFDYSGYRNAIGKAACESIQNKLAEIGIKVDIEFEKIKSPRFYNFETDSIYCKYSLTKTAHKAIGSYLKKHRVAFTEYVKDTFTSRSGFISYYTTDMDIWFGEYLTTCKSVPFASMLEFILTNEGYTYEDLYYGCEGIYLEGELKEGACKVTIMAQTLAHDLYNTHNITEITGEVMNKIESERLDSILNYPEWLDFDYVENIVRGVFNEVASHSGVLFTN